MGVLYAKVNGSWEAITGGGGAQPDWTLGFPTYDPRYVNVGGDTMTGALALPTVAGVSTNPVDFVTNGIRRMRVEGTSGTTGAVSIGDPATSGNNSNWPLSIYGNANGGRIQFFAGANPQSVVGQVGMFDATTMEVRNQAGGPLNLQAGSTVVPGGTFQVASDPQAGAANGAITLGDGRWINAIQGSPNVFNMRMERRVSPASDAGGNYIIFRRNASTTIANDVTIGSIAINTGGSSVVYNTSSDHRLKADHGEIAGALERINRLTPRRIHWLGDPNETEMDGFFAHEVSDAVPEAVTGEKDAVATATDDNLGVVEGQIIPQQLDATRLIPLLVAAIKELSAQVAELRGT